MREHDGSVIDVSASEEVFAAASDPGFSINMTNCVQ